MVSKRLKNRHRETAEGIACNRKRCEQEILRLVTSKTRRDQLIQGRKFLNMGGGLLKKPWKIGPAL